MHMMRRLGQRQASTMKQAGRVWYRFLLLCLLVLGTNLTAPVLAQAAYTDNGDGTVTDTITNLTWKRCAEGQTWSAGSCGELKDMSKYTWDQATSLVATFAGKSDWRLPTITELQSLVTAITYSPTISSLDPVAFPGQNSVFWSVSTDASSSAKAIYLNAMYGTKGSMGKGNNIAVHLVSGTINNTTTTTTLNSSSSTTTTTTNPNPTMPLSVSSGWNLLGNCLNQTIDVSKLYDDPATVTTVWKWNAATSSWQFYTPAKTAEELAIYVKDKGYGVLSEIKPGEGYWVNATSSLSLTLSGQPISLTTSDLVSGWNLMSTADDISPADFNLKLSSSPPGLGEGIPNNFTTLWTWDNALSKWYFYAPSLDALTMTDYIKSKGYLDFTAANMTLGKGIGFWINKGAGTVTIDKPKLSLVMTKDDGATPVTSVTNTDPALVTATLLDADGKQMKGAIVTFSVEPADFGAFAGGANTTLTDASGVAQVKLVTSNVSGGAATVKASAMVSGNAVESTLNYSIGSSVLSLSAIVVPTVPDKNPPEPATLSAYGTANLSVSVLNNGEPYSTPIAVTFTSACATLMNGNGEAKAYITPSVTTVNGIATASYQDHGCNNESPGDTITATLLNGVTATANLKVASPEVGSLQFVSVETNPISTPPMITLKGTGGIDKAESAKVTFKVVDSAGYPLGNQLVTFDLSTKLGGLSLSAYSAPSDPTTGNVVTYVQSGTMSTSVKVTATTGDQPNVLSTQSGLLYISTGIPAQDSMTISAETYNIEGFDFDNVSTKLTVHLADHFHNPVVDGTAVYFTSEGGTVDSACITGDITAGGTKGDSQCSVMFTSAGLRPNNGRVTIMARTTGDEAFIDLNSNGVVDSTKEMKDANALSTDIGEAYLDFDESGWRDPDLEPFIDFNGNGKYDGVAEDPLSAVWQVGGTLSGDGKYNGLLCNDGLLPPDSICSSQKSIDVRKSIVVVLSGSIETEIRINEQLLDPSKPYNPSTNPLIEKPIALQECNEAAGTSGVPQQVTVNVVDKHGNALPKGTKIYFQTNNGTIADDPFWGADVIVPNTSACNPIHHDGECPSPSASSILGDFHVTMTGDGEYDKDTSKCINSSKNGTFTVYVKTPNGVVSTKGMSVTD